MIPLLQILLQSSIRATLVALIVGVLLAAAKIRSSSLRHTAWLAVLCAMLMMPFLPYVIPALPAPVPIPSISSARFESSPDPPPLTEAPIIVGRTVLPSAWIVQPAAIAVILVA